VDRIFGFNRKNRNSGGAVDFQHLRGTARCIYFRRGASKKQPHKNVRFLCGCKVKRRARDSNSQPVNRHFLSKEAASHSLTLLTLAESKIIAINAIPENR
jgi:hypothetical protein